MLVKSFQNSVYIFDCVFDLLIEMDANRCTETIGEDECVFYIYPNELLLNKEENKLKAVVENLNAVKREADLLSEGYIWHNELFEIQPQNLVGKLLN